MRITGTSTNVFVEYDGKTLIMDGEMVVNGFFAEASTMRWKQPYESEPISAELKKRIISDVIKETENKDFRIFFE